MASEAGIAFVNIAAYALVTIVRLWIGVTIGTHHFRIIIDVAVAIGTIIPSALVSAAVYWEVLAIVVKGCWCPPIFVVTSGTISRKLGSCVVGFGCVIVVRLMTTHTGIRRIAKITVMATGAIIGYQCVCAIEGVE